IGDWRTVGNALGNLGSVAKDRGDLRRADSLYAEAGQVRLRTGDRRGRAADENNRGLIAQTLGDLVEARQAFEVALVANREAARPEPAAANLINLGNIADLQGRPQEAATHYHEALELYRGSSNRVGVAEVWHDLGLLSLSEGDFNGAISALERARVIYARTGPPAALAVVARDLAEARAARGDPQGALRELEGHAGLKDPDAKGALLLARADLEAMLNRPADAALSFTRARALYHAAGDAAGEAQAEQGQGYLELVRGENARAGAAFAEALSLQGTLDPGTRALTRVLAGYALRQAGDTARARALLSNALDTLDAVQNVVGQAMALHELGELTMQEGLALAAESLYQRGIERIAGRPAPGVAWELHASLGAALRSRGALSAAAAELRRAAELVEAVASRLPLEWRRGEYLADKWDVYAELALVERARGDVDSAFVASERLRARETLDLLTRAKIAPYPRPGDSLAIREQELRFRVSDLTRRLEDGEGDGPLREPEAERAGADDVLREALAAAQTAYADLLTRMRESDPAYAHTVEGRVMPASELEARLRPDEVVLEYLVTDPTTLVFVVTHDTLAVLDLGVGRRTLAALVDFTRGAVSRPSGPGVPDWRAPLARLHRVLVEPIEQAGLLRDARSLLIVPHAELHYLPFAALRPDGTDARFLVERYDVTVLPSASVWARIRDRGQSIPRGVMALAPRVDALQGTRHEVAEIARIYGPDAHVMVGGSATRQALIADAPAQGIIHLATYGVLNKHNPLFSFVELAPGGAPGDDRLEVHDVFGLELHARLVVLSACQTGVGSGVLSDVPAGDDWVGLVQGFLAAGARNVMASLWPVDDRATAELMARFYTELQAGRPEASALAGAQRETLRKRGTVDPFYWAGFALSGGG
ncbi:MAG TPA: CHAT domain-containing tetratricopeptide repeat protein, partial [Gemmatimonadales bacterium]